MGQKEQKFSEGCVFCNIARGAVRTTLLHNDPEVMAFNDINPKAPIHILVLPKKHIASVRELDDAEVCVIGKMFSAARDLAKEKKLGGYKLVVNVGREGGQIVDHLHLHLLSGEEMRMP